MEELRSSQFREDKLRGMHAMVVRQRLSDVTTVKRGHMARQCTKPKRPRNSTWFKEKAMLAEALESMVVLDEEQMAFLADNGD
ncbi:hypothetical protein Tco_1318353 [Tanacetum coccineum]